MKRRVLAAVAAIVLAVLGGVLVLTYVAGADQRALAGMQPVDVLVVTQPVPQGTPADQLGGAVALTELPATAVADGALTTLDDLAGQVTTTDLQVGEQLLAARFADPSVVDTGAVEIPAGMHQVSVLLDPSRVVGGRVQPGDLVGVFVSLTEPARTRLTLDKVLVTAVQGGVAPAPETEGDAAPAADAPPGPDVAPTGAVMVTLAVNPPDAERLVFAAEHATVWLSLEPEDATTDGTRIVTEENVYP
ncbi:Flp pilus assembly protein CpaB [Georgenia thermotolerans]|uniref:Flp pilus assembly protein CpaB n=1 Tax=Georgenia thermotolerans TaxID=527326 RepID=A0A7J5UM64_9MICO|nr:Flp pilus assembly protein CpaB [Georgenia thermotolerans]KAE8763446.1 Flp pilus assembly protein CpaB [Georgenia thermotolerans]